MAVYGGDSGDGEGEKATHGVVVVATFAEGGDRGGSVVSERKRRAASARQRHSLAEEVRAFGHELEGKAVTVHITLSSSVIKESEGDEDQQPAGARAGRSGGGALTRRICA